MTAATAPHIVLRKRLRAGAAAVITDDGSASPRKSTDKSFADWPKQFGQTKVEHFHLVALGNENVRWLDVSVDDSLRVGRVQSLSDLRAQLGHLLRLHRPASNPVLECLALQKLHHNERLAGL